MEAQSTPLEGRQAGLVYELPAKAAPDARDSKKMTILRWIIFALVALDALAILWLLLRDGGRESEVWLAFLLLPVLILFLTALYFLLRLILAS